ncbi:hypothetical protein [Amycolatopsis keratiniphila]|uniref:hypothetical protein n=1 Tax=Amycolatopsis keratiniphila TaxID=129921 RepID=UPI00087B69BF|nr:hypothetical protein [Amycolatopsis keratiniphila]OLZ51238.1 hypothetical protein BS330_27825 [Amycolatopsis keratiniphila subsp. nogabecina]SDU29727.1 hypothetical protein SAMN04489733_2814 [Amycolatopsis keratiniphila]
MTAAEPAGLVVVVEDLHWADEASLRLLRHLAGELRRSKLAVVATHRDTGHTPALDAALPDLLRRPGARSISLPPLAESDARALLTGLAEDEVREAYRRSGGNPLYLGAIARSAGGAELGHLVRSAVAALGPEVRRLFAIAAVLGEDVDAGNVARPRSKGTPGVNPRSPEQWPGIGCARRPRRRRRPSGPRKRTGHWPSTKPRASSRWRSTPAPRPDCPKWTVPGCCSISPSPNTGPAGSREVSTMPGVPPTRG